MDNDGTEIRLAQGGESDDSRTSEAGKQAEREARNPTVGKGTDDGDRGADVDRDHRNANGSDGGYHLTLSVSATAYTSECEGCSGITATGVDVRSTTEHEGRRVIAVDPKVIPLGTKVIVTLRDGTELQAIAEDVGGAIDGNEIDILVGTYSEAIAFGVQNVKLTIINEGGR